MIISGQGEFHLNTMKWRIEHNDKLEIEFYPPRIPYRETITKYAYADYRHKKQSGGAGQFGEVHLVIEPYTEGMPAPTMYKINGVDSKISFESTGCIFPSYTLTRISRAYDPVSGPSSIFSMIPFRIAGMKRASITPPTIQL